MEHKRIIKHLSDISDNIKNDKVRLNNIVNILNSGKDNSDINDKLIDTLTNMEFDNPSYAIANEYISILFTNIQTQKIAYNKEVTEELIKILNHNLSLLDTVEGCVSIMNDSVSSTRGDIERRIRNVSTRYKRRETDKQEFSFKSFLAMTMPTNKVSNVILWISFMVIILTGAYLIDRNFYKNATEVTVTISDAIHNNDKKYSVKKD